jgi:hypothetical protein
MSELPPAKEEGAIWANHQRYQKPPFIVAKLRVAVNWHSLRAPQWIASSFYP